jgi:Putative prokaryotic signal transducing protein
MSDDTQKTEDNALVTVATFTTPVEAEMARVRLERLGIQAFLGNAVAVGVMPFLGNDLGGISLQVLEKDAEQARELLAS